MNKLFAYILLLSLALPFSARTFVLFDFVLNLNYYSTVICVNKDKPEMGCNGNCYLMAELKKTDLDSQSNNSNSAELPEVFKLTVASFVLFESDKLQLTKSYIDIKLLNVLYLNNYTFLYNFSIIKPPIY